ncbi:MAG TPA: hypothetical protein VFZ49_09860 [Pyrinomonadaceae bacterium]
METQDLGKALHAVTDNDAFRAAAKSEPDFSALDGIKVGVAVTGFETKEERVSDESSVLNFQPRFVAVAETNAWNFQAIKFAENKLGEFVNDIYGGGVELERFPRFDGDYFVWTSQDGRKAYGLVIGSLIFFGNDETAIEKCVAVRKAEAESIAKDTRLKDEEFGSDVAAAYVARGFVSEQGVAQISNLAGVQIAIGAADDGDVRSFVARVLPEIARNSIKGITWTTAKSADLNVIFDHFQIDFDPETTDVLEKQLIPSGSGPHRDRLEFIPADVPFVTSYTIENVGGVWLAVLKNAQGKTDARSGGLIAAFASSLFDAYAIDDPELFLGAVGNGILTARFDVEGDDVVVVAGADDLAAVKRSIAKEISFAKPPQAVGDVRIWRSEDGDVAFANVGSVIVTGNADSVLKAIEARANGQNYAAMNLQPQLFSKAHDVVLTVSKGRDPDARLVRVLSQRADGNPALEDTRKVSTFMNDRRLWRVERSNFGLIGSIIEQFAKDP